MPSTLSTCIRQLRTNRQALGAGRRVAKRVDMAQRMGIVNATENTGVLQRGHDSVAFRVAHEVQVINVTRLFPFRRQHQVGVCQHLVVHIGHGTALFGPLFDVTQLDQQHGGLQRIEAAVVTEYVVLILDALSVISQQAELIRQFGVVGDDGASIAKGTQVLAGVETKTSCIAQRPCPPIVILRTVCLGRILDDFQAVSVRDASESSHAGTLSVKVHGNDRLSPWSDRLLDQIGVDRVVQRVDVDEDSIRAGIGNGERGRGE